MLGFSVNSITYCNMIIVSWLASRFRYNLTHTILKQGLCLKRDQLLPPLLSLYPRTARVINNGAVRKSCRESKNIRLFYYSLSMLEREDRNFFPFLAFCTYSTHISFVVGQWQTKISYRLQYEISVLHSLRIR